MSNQLLLLAVISGFLFGAWPLIMNRSGLDGYTSAVLFEFFALLVVLPIALIKGMSVMGTKWWLAILAAILAGFGIIFFTSGLSKTTTHNVAKFFLIMLVVQTAVPVCYHVIENQELSFKNKLGLISALITAFLLS
jgi:hypothetical protein